MTTLNNMDHTERADSSLRFILQNNNKPPFELAIDPDTGRYGYIKVGADSVTPFSSIMNIASSVSEIKTFSYTTDNNKVRFDITRDGLFAGSASGYGTCWFQGNAYSATFSGSCIYYPPEGSLEEPHVIFEATNQASAGSSNTLFSVEEGGYVELATYVCYSPYTGHGCGSMSGVIIYLADD